MQQDYLFGILYLYGQLALKSLLKKFSIANTWKYIFKHIMTNSRDFKGGGPMGIFL